MQHWQKGCCVILDNCIWKSDERKIDCKILEKIVLQYIEGFILFRFIKTEKYYKIYTKSLENDIIII